MKIRGGMLLARALLEKGVSQVFTLSGGFCNPALEGLMECGISVINAPHEQVAGRLADGYTRITRTLAVCLVGPEGFANAVPAMMEAWGERSPVIFITGSSTLKRQGSGGFKEIDELKQSIKDGKDAADAVAKSLEDLRKELSEVDNNPAEVSRLSEAISDKEEELTTIEKEIKSQNTLLEVKEGDKSRGEASITRETESYTKFSQKCDDYKADFETYITELETILSNWDGVEFSESYNSRIATVKTGVNEDLVEMNATLTELSTSEKSMIESITVVGKASDLSSCDATNKGRASDAIVANHELIAASETAMVESDLVEHIVPTARVAAEDSDAYEEVTHEMAANRIAVTRSFSTIKGSIGESCPTNPANVGIINALELVESRGNTVNGGALSITTGKPFCCRISNNNKCCRTLGGNFLTGLKFSDENFTGGGSQEASAIPTWLSRWIENHLKSNKNKGLV